VRYLSLICAVNSLLGSGVDFDSNDPDEMEVMHLVWDREKHDRMAQLERENERLRMRLAEYESTEDDVRGRCEDAPCCGCC
jgi:hypothetical protein